MVYNNVLRSHNRNNSNSYLISSNDHPVTYINDNILMCRTRFSALNRTTRCACVNNIRPYIVDKISAI